MLQIAIVVFREILEVALIIGILTASTKEIPGRTKYILIGLIFGIIGSLILAFSTNKLSESLDGLGQEFFNGLILLTAAFMIGWTVIWMQKHKKSFSSELRQLGSSVRAGTKPLYILTIVILLSILREGTEIVLFTYSYYISGTTIYDIIFGLIGGIAAGVIVGLTLYLGMLKAFGKYFFTITTWLLVFLASGIAASGVGFWINAEIIPALGSPAINLSEILSQQSLLGKFLHIFFGYIDHPAGTQLIAYFVALTILITSLKTNKILVNR